jgi:TP901 family phage tail tape measure protein
MATLKVAIDATGAQAGAQKTKQALDSIRNASRTASQSTREFDKAQKDATGGSLKFGGALAQLGIAFSFAQVIRSTTANIVEFDRAIRELEAVTGATGAQLAALESRARDLGATTEFTAKQAADGLTFLARAGFDTQQSLDAIGATLDIATAGTLGLAEAADIASNVVSTFNLEAAQTAEVGDILVATANNANTNVQQLAEAIKFAGNVASAVGVPLEDLSAAVGVLGNRGVQASLAGTNLRGIIAGLLGPTTEAQERIRALGLTLADIDPTTKSLAEIFEAFAAAGLEASDAVAIFGRRNVGAALAFRDSTDELRNLNQEIQDADGAASDAADTVRDSLKGSIDSLKSAVSELQLVLGEGGLSGALRGTVDLATDVVRALSGSSNEFQNNEVAVRSLAAAVETLAIAAGVAGLAKALSLAKVATLGLSAALRANPIGLTITALAGAVALFDQFTRKAVAARTARRARTVKRHT